MHSATTSARREWLPWVAVALTAIIAVCAFAPFAAAVAGTRITSYDDGSIIVNACLSAAIQRDPHIALSWRLPGNPKIERSAWVRTYPGLLCLKLPRLQIIPTSGTLRFPPTPPAEQ